MKTQIIAIVLALGALGVGGFATARTFDDGPVTQVLPTGSIWTNTECEAMREQADSLFRLCAGDKNGACQARADLQIAIATNCR